METEAQPQNTEPTDAEAPANPIVRQVTIDPAENEQPGVAPDAEPEAAPDQSQPPIAVVAAGQPVPDATEEAPEGGVAQPAGEDAPAAEAAGDPALAQVAEAVTAEPEEEEPENDPYAEEEEEEEQPKLMALGVMDMDKKLGGGVPLETLTLVEGDPEAGKSVVIQQLAYGALKEGFRVSVFLSEHKLREFLDQMSELGMNTTDYYLVGRMSLYEANLRVDQERAERLTKKLLNFIEKDDTSDVYIVDSITPLLFQFDARYVLSFLAQCKELSAVGKTIMVTLHSYAINESLRLRADSIVDAHLRLKIEELGAQVVRTLEVAKIRGAVKTIGNAVSFNVEAGLGLKSIPISKTKA